MLKSTRTFLLLAVLVTTVRKSHQNALTDVTSNKVGEVLEEKLVEQRSNWVSSSNGKCFHGFTYLPSSRSCYMVVYESHDWYSAATKCRRYRRDAHLAAITSAEENLEVKTYLANEVARNSGTRACYLNGEVKYGHAFWTSGQQLIKGDCKAPYVWRLSNDKLLSFGFTSWIGGEPNCGNNLEFCVSIWVYHNFRWDDVLCAGRTCPLCEYTP